MLSCMPCTGMWLFVSILQRGLQPVRLRVSEMIGNVCSPVSWPRPSEVIMNICNSNVIVLLERRTKTADTEKPRLCACRCRLFLFVAVVELEHKSVPFCFIVLFYGFLYWLCSLGTFCPHQMICMLHKITLSVSTRLLCYLLTT